MLESVCTGFSDHCSLATGEPYGRFWHSQSFREQLARTLSFFCTAGACGVIRVALVSGTGVLYVSDLPVTSQCAPVDI